MGRTIRRAPVALVCTALVCAALSGVATVLAAPAGAASFTVAATPSTGLVDGQAVNTQITGFTGTEPAIAECTASGAAAARISDCVSLAVGSTSATITVQQQILTSDQGLVDCGAAPGTCVVAASDVSNVTPSNVATTPLTFARPAPPTIAAFPTSDLIEGTTILVGARGFAPNTTAVVQQCGPDTAAGHCDTTDAVTTSTDATGAFVTQLVVHRFLPTPDGTVDCGVVACAITAPPAVTATVALQFPVPHTKVTVTPDTGLVDGQVIGVNVVPPREVLAECVAGSTQTGGCDASTVLFPSSYPASFAVRRMIDTLDGRTVDCAAAPGTCVIVAADLSDVNATIGSAPLTFGTPNTPPDCSGATATPGRLWPPNHRLVTVTVGGVTDPDHDAVTVVVTGVTQDEPVLGTGPGDVAPDAVRTAAANAVQLRAERAGSGNGRVYALSFSASDGHGGTCGGTVHVSVAHDASGRPAVDSGQRYDSFATH